MRIADWRVLPVLLATIVMSACSGWYLRGTRTSDMDITSVYVTASNAARLRAALIQGLIDRGIGITGKRASAEATIELANERYERNVLSVDPDTGKVREVELQMEAQYTVRAGDGKLIAPRQTLSWTNDFVFDEGSLLGTVEQEELLRVELANNAARAIILRLGTLKLPER